MKIQWKIVPALLLTILFAACGGGGGGGSSDPQLDIDEIQNEQQPAPVPDPTIEPAVAFRQSPIYTDHGGFEDNGDSYTDTNTGRIWSRDFGRMTWDEAAALPAQLNAEVFLGRDDWRLPAVDELMSLVRHDVGQPAIHPIFTDDVEWEVGSWGYWTIHTGQWRSDFAHLVSYFNGSVWSNDKSSPGNARFVAGGDLNTGTTDFYDPLSSPDSMWEQTCNQDPTSVPKERFEILGDGSEVLDLATGLTWSRCTEGQEWDGSTCVSPIPEGFVKDPYLYGYDWHMGTQFTYPEAVEYADSIDGWRIPTYLEAQSIQELRCAVPSVNPVVFPNTPHETIWTTTRSPENGIHILGANIAGETGLEWEEYPLHLRLVR